MWGAVTVVAREEAVVARVAEEAVAPEMVMAPPVVASSATAAGTVAWEEAMVKRHRHEPPRRQICTCSPDSC